MGYEKVTEAIQEHGLSWSEIDRIELSESAYEDFFERASFTPSNYATNDKPAVRVTMKREAIYYVDSDGQMQIIDL